MPPAPHRTRKTASRSGQYPRQQSFVIVDTRKFRPSGSVQCCGFGAKLSVVVPYCWERDSFRGRRARSLRFIAANQLQLLAQSGRKRRSASGQKPLALVW